MLPAAPVMAMRMGAFICKSEIRMSKSETGVPAGVVLAGGLLVSQPSTLAVSRRPATAIHRFSSPRWEPRCPVLRISRVTKTRALTLSGVTCRLARLSAAQRANVGAGCIFKRSMLTETFRAAPETQRAVGSGRWDVLGHADFVSRLRNGLADGPGLLAGQDMGDGPLAVDRRSMSGLHGRHVRSVQVGAALGEVGIGNRFPPAG